MHQSVDLARPGPTQTSKFQLTGLGGWATPESLAQREYHQRQRCEEILTDKKKRFEEMDKKREKKLFSPFFFGDNSSHQNSSF